MQTVTLPKRTRKNTVVISPELIEAVSAQLAKVKKGQAVAYEPDKFYDTEGKARSRARTLALAIAEKTGVSQPKTHVVADDSGERFTPALSPGR